MKKTRISFKEYYKNIIPDLTVLQKTSVPILKFAKKDEKELKKIWEENHLTWNKISWHPQAIYWPIEKEAGTNLPGNTLFYVQNASSLLPVINLDAQSTENILDACAAPGGKALFINESECNLTVNDISTARIQRLLKIFTLHNQKKPNYHTANAATLFKKYPNHFDRILLDAPCSSEKHVYNSEKHLKEWSPGRIRQLKQRQISLINGLFLALKKGGRLVYSTCAINQEENHAVIEKFLKEHQAEVKIIPYPKNLPGLNKQSPYGYIDINEPKNENLDPMFIAIIEKNN